MKIVYMFVLLFSLTRVGGVFASTDRAFTGSVMRVSPKLIEVQNGAKTVKVTGHPAAAASRRIHVGDWVTVYSQVDGVVTTVKLAKKPGNKLKNNQEGGQKGQDVLDDRAFYSASS